MTRLATANLDLASEIRPDSSSMNPPTSLMGLSLKWDYPSARARKTKPFGSLSDDPILLG